MVVDRGGLNYPIRVIDEFSANTQKFRDEIRKAREEFIKFRRSSRLLNKQVSSDQKQATKALKQSQKDQKASDRERVLRFKQNINQQEILRKLSAQQNKDSLRETSRLATLQTATSRNVLGFKKKALKIDQKLTAQGTLLRRSLVAQDSAANKLLFTFRRLVGVLALFTIARQVSAGFGALVKSGFAFNQTIERSRLGIAGIITAVGRVKDEQGKVVKGAQAFVVATGLAREQQKLLQRDALLTTATFEELLNVFQIATGPGLAANLNLDQIRKISILVSQAASAIDLPQNQLSEEIRALLTGNIRTTTTRIAQVLNLTPSDVKGAIKQGQLFQLLTTRLQGFSLAAEKTAQTVGGLAARIKGALQVIAGEANVKGFDSLRIVLDKIFKSLLLIKRDAKGAIESFKVNPDAVKPFTAIFDAIDSIIRITAGLGQSIGFDGLTSAAEGFAGILSVVGQGIAVIVAGFISGFGTISEILSVVLVPFNALAELIDEIFGEGALVGFLALLVQIAVVFGGLGVVLSAILGIGPRLVRIYLGLRDKLRAMKLAINLIVAGTKIWVKESRIAGGVWRALKSPVTLFVGLLAAALLSTKLILESAFDMKLTFAQVGLLVAASLTNQFRTAVVEMAILVLRTKELFGIFNKDIVEKKGFARAFVDTVTDIKVAVATGLADLVGADKAADLLRKISVTRILSDDKIVGDAGKDRVTEEMALRSKLQAAINSENVKFQELIASIIGDTDQDKADADLKGTVAPALKALTEDDKKSALAEQRKLRVLSIRLTLGRRLAQIAEQQTSEGERELAIIKAEGSALRNQLALRDSILARAETLAQRDVDLATKDGVDIDDSKLEFLQDRLAQIQLRRKFIQFDINTATIEEREQIREIGIESRGLVSIGREKLAQAQRESDFSVQLLESDRARALLALGSATSEEEKAVILERIKRLNIDITTQKLLQEQANAKAIFDLKFTAAQARGEALEGLQLGFLSFAEEFKNAFDAAVDIAQQSVARLADFIAGALSSAFDPNNDTSIKERLGQFLADISKIIITALTKLAIAKLILGFAGPSFGDSAANTPFFSAAGGGRIPSSKTQASVAHYARPQGLARGGRPTPPKGVDRRDTTPIWAQPGEFMMRLSAVKKYGIGVMNAINSGAMDPTSLASMTGARRMSRNTKRTVGFAVGGEVRNAGQTVAAATGGSEGGGIGIGLLVANEQTAERFLAGGKKAFLDFIDENGADIDGRLARFRS